MKNIFLVIVLFCLTLISCQSPSHLSGEIKNIDMNQAFDQTGSITLSEVVKAVEIIQFYPAVDTYFVNARSFAVGKKYVMINDDGGGGKSRIILCERSGKFVTNIGRMGKGPGEFVKAWLTVMDPSERFIIIADDRSNKLIKYSVSGEFIMERKMDELANRSIFDDIKFINDNEFVLVPRRPVQAQEGFASMLVYDLDLNASGKILPRANDKNLTLFNNGYQTLGEGADRSFYWEPYFDTLYTVNPDHSTEATHVIGWSKNGPSFEYLSSFIYKLPPDKQKPINFIYGISETGKYIFIGGMSNGDRFMAAYNKKSEDLFVLPDTSPCDTSSYQGLSIFKNDLFGIEPVYISRYEQMADRYVTWLRAGSIASSYDLDCIRSKDVKLPDVRDRLLEIAEGPDAENNMVLLLMEGK